MPRVAGQDLGRWLRWTEGLCSLAAGSTGAKGTRTKNPARQPTAARVTGKDRERTAREGRRDVRLQDRQP